MKVKFLPDNIEFDIKPGQTVKDLADEKNIYIKSICNGLPSCSECRVRVVEGDSNVLPPSSKELNLIGTGYFIDQRRLSCQLLCFGDVTIDLTEQNEKQKQGPRRLLGNRKMDASNAVSGNLIEQDAELKQMMANPQPQSDEKSGEHQRPQNSRPQQQQQRESRGDNRRDQHGRDGGKGGGGRGRDNRNRNNNNNRNQQQQTRPQQPRAPQQQAQTQQQGQSSQQDQPQRQHQQGGQQQNNRPNKPFRYKPPGQN